MHVFIPSTFATDERDEKLLVQRIGQLARSIAIFGADTITIYQDEDPKADEKRNAEIMEKYLRYAECPPYLRKALIPRDPDLKYANILPPLQILSHGYEDRFREAVVTDVTGTASTLNAGLDKPVTLEEPLEDGARVTVMKTDDGWELIDQDAIDGFWTFTVQNERTPIGDLLNEMYTPVIGTSARGEPLHAFTESEYAEQDVALVFGSAWRGLYDVIDRGDCTESQFDSIYNCIPEQHTKTVRTSEAVPIVLGVVNAYRHG
jgi:predicted SPOUT superfamily RNA methylase MTH1